MSDPFTPSTEACDLVALVRAAARQRQIMQPWLEDRRFSANGGKLLYIVDTDVVKLFTTPDKVAVPSRHRREGYAQVFPGDDRELSIALGRALARHIFTRLSKDRPLLLFPPMEQELRRVFAGVTRDAKEEEKQAKEALHHLRSEWRHLKDELSRIEDEGARVERLEQDAPALARLLGGERGAGAEMRRFGELIRSTRIAPLAFALERGWIPDPALHTALKAPEDFRAMVRIHDLREAWFARLYETKSKKASSVLINDDAQVLARLEWVNGRLDGERYRVMLITGDPALHEAASRFEMPGRGRSFADLFVRHPRAYLAEPGVLSPDELTDGTGEAIGTELLDWLDTFLAEHQVGDAGARKGLGMTPLDEADHRHLQRRAAQVLDSHPGILDELKQAWFRYTRGLVLAQCIRQGSWLALDTDGREAMNALFERIADRLAQRVTENWEACFEAATEVGYGLLFHQPGSGDRARNAPPLSFGSFPRAWTFVQHMLSSRATGQIEPQKFRHDMQALQEEDRSRYTYNLAFGVLFATEGIWHVAAILGERAMEIAGRERPRRVSGREAAYLRAVALRHSARSPRDLADVGGLLDKAERCLHEDRQERPDLRAGDIRFPAERLALDLTYRLFGRFLGSAIPDGVLPLPRLQEALEQQAETALDHLERLRRERASLKAGMGNAANDERRRSIRAIQREAWITRCVERNLLTNLFMTALMREGQTDDNVDPGELRPWFERFAANLEASTDPEMQVSFLVRVVHLTADWWTTPDSRRRRGLRKALLDLLNDEAIKVNAVLPYDRKRFELLRDLVSRGHR